MSTHLKKIQKLLEEAYENQAYMESIMSQHRDDDWAELYVQNKRYIEELRETYQSVERNTRTEADLTILH